MVVVTQPQFPQTLTAGRDRILGTLIGAAVAAPAIAGRLHGLPTLPLYVAGLVPLAFLTGMWPNLRLSCITLTILLLVPSGASSLLVPVHRVLEIVLGTVSALIVSFVRFPKRADQGQRQS